MSKPEEITELRQIMIKIQEASREWLEAKAVSEQLEADAGPFLDALRNSLADGKKSESQLTREARGSGEYREFIRGMVTASMKTITKHRRLLNLERWWETSRSEVVSERTKIKMGIFSEGG